ncbi:MAG TPA: hypothetical protein VNY06_05820, partial [Methylocella sp.]|nr:hypothetical protein [Methylocella sp.]
IPASGCRSDGPKVALATLGLRKNRPKQIEEAIAAYREEEGTYEKAPGGWAVAKMNLGLALATLRRQMMAPTALSQPCLHQNIIPYIAPPN